MGIKGHAVSIGGDAFAGYKDGKFDANVDAALLFGVASKKFCKIR